MQVIEQDTITPICPHASRLTAAEAEALRRTAAIWLSAAGHVTGEPRREALTHAYTAVAQLFVFEVVS